MVPKEKEKKKNKNEKGQQKTDFSLFNNQTCEGKKKKKSSVKVPPLLADEGGSLRGA